MQIIKRNLIYLILVFQLLLSLKVVSQNRLGSRAFYNHPNLYDSKSQVNWIKNKAYIVLEPIDNRVDFYGEIVYKKKRVQQYNDFWKELITTEIQEKIIRDLNHLTSMEPLGVKSTDSITILPTIEVFYPDVRGFIWGKSFAKVRINFKVFRDNNNILFERKYDSFYISSGRDSEWEGKMFETIENGANITIGIALRKVLDNFYKDLNKEL